ncbi:hypothetical protein C8J57DRAFT_1521744 [Mycena rebaudengoi]|nr:hypothetical protein C8J57DRAFT_1521744 [Mycena rebaudengoi]
MSLSAAGWPLILLCNAASLSASPPRAVLISVSAASFDDQRRTLLPSDRAQNLTVLHASPNSWPLSSRTPRTPTCTPRTPT